jgi:UPF0755 protein
MLRSVIRALLLVIIASAAAYAFLVNYLQSPMAIQGESLEYTLEPGGSLNSVVNDLHARGYLKYPRLLSLYSRLTGEGQRVQAGHYSLQPGISPGLLLAKLSSGDIAYYQLTLVEGWNLRQVLDYLQQVDDLKPSDLSLSTLAKQLQISQDGNNLEGLFFPDTYQYHRGMSGLDILLQANARLQAVLAEEWQRRDKTLAYKTPYEALIMASIVEKETGVASERNTIAGVFIRRLQKRMRLQTDPTVIYGLGESFDGNLRSRHLKDSSNVYNTYRHFGLPPTPIALAGREAIHAALNPEAGSSLYFVAKGDGSHYFSATLEEHNKAVRKYQITQRRKDYSSAPK